ncbi:MAG: N-acetyltransferase [Rhodocyclaceae bacterium]|nr:N-acetyltransferase [Rhodocyclaceae bacterium]
MGDDFTLRQASDDDAAAIDALHCAAFGPDEGPRIAHLAVQLLDADTSPPTRSLVALSGGMLIGHVAFSPVWCADDTGWFGYLLAPLGVMPGHQKAGIGARLVEYGIQRLAQAGVGAILVYGDPAYYGRFGFRGDLAAHYGAPCALTHPFGWQALRLADDGGGVRQLSCVAPLQDPGLW